MRTSLNPKIDLGFGCMRLPVLDRSDPTSFDHEKICALFDAFLERGFSYFDTAYVYHNYCCETEIRKALVERHPRERFQLCTKLPLRDFEDEADMEHIFQEQLTNRGVVCFDYYLLHNMGRNVYDKCCKYGAFHFVKRKQKEGAVGITGMSFHDSPELLEEILDKFGDCLDVLQLQINYVDWEEPTVQSRRCLEIANKYGKPVIVMEPCKGGTLVGLPKKAEKLLRNAAPNMSNAEWAFRYAGGQPGVIRVLSGMNAVEQLEDNCGIFSNFHPLDERKQHVLEEVAEVIRENTAVHCTACGYCVNGCPKNIAIPQYFSLYNSVLRTTGSFSSQTVYYNNISQTHGKAEQACPQHLPIIRHLKDVTEKFENTSFFPTRK